MNRIHDIRVRFTNKERQLIVDAEAAQKKWNRYDPRVPSKFNVSDIMRTALLYHCESVIELVEALDRKSYDADIPPIS